MLVLSALYLTGNLLRGPALQLPQPEDPPCRRVDASSPGSPVWSSSRWSLTAVFAAYLAPQSPTEGDITQKLIPPIWMERGDWEHPLGTDRFGRDVLSRIIYGSRISLARLAHRHRRGGHVRHGARPDLGLSRRPHRRRPHAADRHRPVAADHPDRGGAGRGLRAELPQRHPGDRAPALAALRAADPRRDAGDQGAGLRRAGGGGRTLERLDHPAPHLPQRGADAAGDLHPPGGLRDPPGGDAELPRASACRRRIPPGG